MENAGKYHDKTASGEYEIPRLPNTPGGYSNLGVSPGLIISAAILKCLAVGRSKLRARRTSHTKSASRDKTANKKCKIPWPPNKPGRYIDGGAALFERDPDPIITTRGT